MKKPSKDPIRYGFREIASRITGISTPVFGVSWQPPESERTIIRSVLVFLEDRRALFYPYAFEVEHQVSDSVLQIRSTITDAIQRLPDSSESLPYLRAMRIACREYLDSSNDLDSHGWRHQNYLIHLGRLRTIFGYQIAKLCVMYGIDVEGGIAKILPPEYTDEKKENK